MKQVTTMRFIDLFSGIGGFRLAVEQTLRAQGIPYECVFSSDIDESAREAYKANFGEYPSGDITKIDARQVPDHDLLLAGFPCQPFSIIGNGKGFGDIRGTLFFDIARILKKKKPKAFILENVKQLVGHNKGKTLKKILSVLRDELGYTVDYKVLNALNYGLPQKRERVFIVGYKKSIPFPWPEKQGSYTPLSELLESNVDPKHYVSAPIRKKRKKLHKAVEKPAIWHENKAGHISSYPYSCALRAQASYNYLLVDGERRLSPREMLRLQGFPDTFKIVVSDSQTRKQAGNAVPVNLVSAVFRSLLPILLGESVKREVPILAGLQARIVVFLREKYAQLQDASATFSRQN